MPGRPTVRLDRATGLSGPARPRRILRGSHAVGAETLAPPPFFPAGQTGGRRAQGPADRPDPPIPRQPGLVSCSVEPWAVDSDRPGRADGVAEPPMTWIRALCSPGKNTRDQSSRWRPRPSSGGDLDKPRETRPCLEHRRPEAMDRVHLGRTVRVTTGVCQRRAAALSRRATGRTSSTRTITATISIHP